MAVTEAEWYSAGDRIELVVDVPEYDLYAGQRGGIVYWDNVRNGGHVLLDWIGSEHRLKSEWFCAVSPDEENS